MLTFKYFPGYSKNFSGVCFVAKETSTIYVSSKYVLINEMDAADFSKLKLRNVKAVDVLKYFLWIFVYPIEVFFFL